MDTTLFSPDSLLWLFGTLVYLELFRRLDRFLSLKKPASDEEYLAFLARKYGISEHDLFFFAAKAWGRSQSRVETDFRHYLVAGHLPHYVRDFVRRERKLSRHA